MGKHRKMGGIWFTASRGTSFKKRSSDTNICVGKEMKGLEYANRKAVQKAFVSALDSCGVNLKPATRTKWKLGGGKVGRPAKAK